MLPTDPVGRDRTVLCDLSPGTTRWRRGPAGDVFGVVWLTPVGDVRHDDDRVVLLAATAPDQHAATFGEVGVEEFGVVDCERRCCLPQPYQPGDMGENAEAPRVGEAVEVDRVDLLVRMNDR